MACDLFYPVRRWPRATTAVRFGDAPRLAHRGLARTRDAPGSARGRVRAPATGVDARGRGVVPAAGVRSARGCGAGGGVTGARRGDAAPLALGRDRPPQVVSGGRVEHRVEEVAEVD